MPEDVFFNRAQGYIYIRSYGVVTLEELEKALEKVLDFHRNGQIDAILVDTREQEKVPGVKEHYQFLQSVPANLHIAIISNRGAETHGNQMFFAEAARYKGKSIRLFDEEAAALKWIKEQERVQSPGFNIT